MTPASRPEDPLAGSLSRPASCRHKHPTLAARRLTSGDARHQERVHEGHNPILVHVVESYFRRR